MGDVLSGLEDRILRSRAESPGILVGVRPPTVSAETHSTGAEAVGRRGGRRGESVGRGEGVVEMGAERVRSKGGEGGEEEKGSRAWLQQDRLKRGPPGKRGKP